MYLYLTFFKEETLLNGRFFSSREYLEPIREKFPNYVELTTSNIKAGIAFVKSKDYSEKNPYIVNVVNVISDDTRLVIDFEIGKEMGITNEFLNKQLYKYSQKNNLIDKESKYPPILYIVNKEDFDDIRKGNIGVRKITNNTEKIDEYKRNNDWKGIVDLFEPLDNLKNHSSWNNPSELYDIAYACSKLGELQLGKEKDKDHLAYIKKYREICIDIYQRCMELEPSNFRYPSGIAYRYYLNVMEVTKQKGRRDTSANKEIDNALQWLDVSLSIYPDNIKDIGRKGYLLLDKKADILRFSNNDWSRDFFKELEEIEREGAKCYRRVIEIYESLQDENKKKFYRKEYIKSLYRLSKYYFKSVKDPWNEYIGNKIVGVNIKLNYNNSDYQNILESLNLIEKCIKLLTNCELNEVEKIGKEIKKGNFWNGSPMDILYQVGNIYLLMYFIKLQLENHDERIDLYREFTEKFLKEAINLGNEIRRTSNNRNTWFISEKLARYYIISGDYKLAIKLLEKPRDSYIKNTYAVALILEGSEESLSIAKQTLEGIIDDRYNKADSLTLFLLLYIYQLHDDYSEIEKIIARKSDLITKAHNLLSILGISEGGVLV